MDSYESLRPGGSGILPEETPPKFLARHLCAYDFVLPYVREKDILEIGFGDGYGSNFLAQHAKGIKAIDVLEKNVHLASNKYKKPNLEFLQMDAVKLNFRDEIFDRVISFQVIEHIDEDLILKYLRGIKRVLKKGGLAFITTLNLEKNKKPNIPYNRNPFHKKEFTYEELKVFIKSIFEIYDIFGLFYSKKLKFFERLKKIGIFKFFPQTFNIVDRFYNNITVDDFVWKKENLTDAIDFMAVCKKL